MSRAAIAPKPPAVAPARETDGRLHFLDHLRAVAILLVIGLHAGITYMVAPPPWWYVLAAENSLAFMVLLLLMDVPIMPALFFVAGFFTYPSLEKHGPARFLHQKRCASACPG